MSEGCINCKLSETVWLTEWSFMVSSFYPGTILGFLLVPFLTRWIGVKRTKGIMCLAASIGIVFHLITPYFLQFGIGIFSSLVSIGRFLIGVQAGSSLCLLPLYIIEISPKEHRHFLNSLQQISQSFATLLGLLLGSEEIFPMGKYRFLMMQLIALFPVIVLFLLMVFTPQTPSYIKAFRPHSNSEVRKSSAFYYGDDIAYFPLIAELKYEKIDRALSQISSISIDNSTNDWKSSFKGFWIGAVVALSYAFTGDDLVDTFSSQMLISNDQPLTAHEETDEFTILASDAFGLILLLASILGLFLADRYGRRKLVLVGLMGTCLANFGASFLGENKILVSVCFGLTKTFIGLGCGGPAWFITSELVRPEHAWIFQPISTGLLLGSTMIETFFYLQVQAILGGYSLILLAAGPALIAAIIIYLFLPETQGRTIDEIQATLHNSTFSGIDKTPRRFENMYGSIVNEMVY